MTPPAPELLYAVNPMCSWCYGFAPSLAALRDARGPSLRITLALGALRAETEAMRPEQKAHLTSAWQRVGQASGQPFDPALLQVDDFAYDTRPASRAVMAARSLGEAAALDLLAAIQQAFYRDARRVTRTDVLRDVADEIGLDGAAIVAAVEDPAAATALERENRDVAALGIEGYPTVVALGPPARVVTVGFLPPAALLDRVDAVLGPVRGS